MIFNFHTGTNSIEGVLATEFPILCCNAISDKPFKQMIGQCVVTNYAFIASRSKCSATASVGYDISLCPS